MLTENEQSVLAYLKLKNGKFISPTEIGLVVGGGKRHSSWGSPICNRLVEKGYAKRHECGWYAAL